MKKQVYDVVTKTTTIEEMTPEEIAALENQEPIQNEIPTIEDRLEAIESLILEGVLSSD